MHSILEVEYSDTQIYTEKSASILNSDIKNSVSIDKDVVIENSIIENSIIYSGAVIKNAIISNSIVGHNCIVNGLEGSIFMGDYSEYENF